MDLARDEFEGGEVADLAGVETGLEREVEGVQRLVVRQPGQFQCVAEPAALAEPDFFLEQEVDEVEVAELTGFGAVDELGEGVGEVGEAEAGGVGADPVGGQLVHRRACCRLGCWSVMRASTRRGVQADCVDQAVGADPGLGEAELGEFGPDGGWCGAEELVAGLQDLQEPGGCGEAHGDGARLGRGGVDLGGGHRVLLVAAVW